MGSGERHQACPGGRSVISQVVGEALLRKTAGQGHRDCWAFIVKRVVETSEVRGRTRQTPGQRGTPYGRTELGIETGPAW